MPYQMIVGKRDLKENLIEIKDRKTYQSTKMNKEESLKYLVNNLNNKI